MTLTLLFGNPAFPPALQGNAWSFDQKEIIAKYLNSKELALLLYLVAWKGYTKSPGPWLYKQRLILFVCSIPDISELQSSPKAFNEVHSSISCCISNILHFLSLVHTNLPNFAQYTAAWVSVLQTIISPPEREKCFIFAHKLSIATSDLEKGF